jgi:hypothetical protein
VSDKIENASADMARRHALKLMASTGAKAAAVAGLASAVVSSKAQAMSFPFGHGHGHHHGGSWGGGSSGGGDGGSTGGGSANCFLRGTMIATPDGEVAIEDLKIGDVVVTADKGAQPILWIARRSFSRTPGRAWPVQVTPVRIAASAIADGAPRRDLYVSPSHGIRVDGQLLPAEFFVNGRTVEFADVKAADRLDYFHIELKDHALLLAEGLEAESLFGADREIFSNFAEFERIYGSEQAQHGFGERMPGLRYRGRTALKGLMLCAAAPVIGMQPEHRAYQRVAERAKDALALG